MDPIDVCEIGQAVSSAYGWVDTPFFAQLLKTNEVASWRDVKFSNVLYAKMLSFFAEKKKWEAFAVLGPVVRSIVSWMSLLKG